MKGRIFAIEEFSTFDGPGIRTTVFLKGCPLKCSWCHNPEGQSFDIEYKRNPNGCVKCKRCERFGVKKDGGIVLTEESRKACKLGLIDICGEDVSENELTERLLKNVEILNKSGGGITFSGGEPLAQAEFYIKCAEIIHGKTSCALQTTGFATSETFIKTLSITDYYLYDLKIFDSEKHARYCGADNGIILKNYKILAKSGKKFVTRIPLIPTVTDTEENISALSDFISSCGVKYVELLPYNKAAGSKYKNLLREYRPDFDEQAEIRINKDLFERNGIQIKIM